MKISRLLYAPSYDLMDQPKVVYQSEHGIPVGWLVLFGGRNFWEPDQSVSQRGGTSALRDRWITPQEVAEARLGNAIEAFNEVPQLWPWFSPLNVLHRRSLTLGKGGVYKLEAHWVLQDKYRAEDLGRTTAIVENIVNSIIANRLEFLPKFFDSLEDYTIFTPKFTAEDASRFENFVSTMGIEPIHAVGHACIGLPTENIDRYHTILAKSCAEPLDTINSLPPYPDPPKTQPPIPEAEKQLEAGSDGIVGKFKGLFKKN